MEKEKITHEGKIYTWDGNDYVSETGERLPHSVIMRYMFEQFTVHPPRQLTLAEQAKVDEYMKDLHEERKQIYEIITRAQSEEGQRLADAAIERYKGLTPDKKVLDLKEHDIMKVLKVSYIAERFFGKSRSWLCHKLNHDIMNGKPDDFTPDERKKLKDALDTIAYEIQILSDNM